MAHEVVALATKRYGGIDFGQFGLNIETNQEKIMDKYAKLKEVGEVLTLKFPFFEHNNLYLFESDVKIVMLRKDMDKYDLKYNDRIEKLKRQYMVKVKEVDRENKTVYVKSAVEEPRKKLIEAIEQGIKEETYVTVPARVEKISGDPVGSVLIINIGMLNIQGSIRIQEWSTAFTKSFYHVAKEGDVIEVAVLKRVKWNNRELYDCSRKQVVLQNNPWKDIENKIPRKTNMRIRCTDKEANYFFGVMEGFGDINVLCEYPDNILIEEAKEYLGYVYKVEEKSKTLKMRIVEEVEEVDRI